MLDQKDKKMKNLVLISFLFFSVLSFSQKEKNIDLRTFYYTAIKNKIDYEKGMIKSGVSARKINDYYFVFKDDSMNDYLPANIEGYKINYINIYGRKNKRLLKKGIYAFQIQPIKLKGGRIEIDLIDFQITYKNKNYNMANGGGSTTVFEYSCSTNKWEFIETKHHGI